MLRLGVNVDHVATVRQARRAALPDPVAAALAAEKAGADGITVHLREDRRHIQERDVERLRAEAATKVNLEMAVTPAMVAFAEKIRPDDACFVPEKREELTTEGGLDLLAHREKVAAAIERLRQRGIRVNLFIDPARAQIETARAVGAHGIEIHTGAYCNAGAAARQRELAAIVEAAAVARGHGLDYENVAPVARISEIVELNIGHSIIARAVMVGIGQAVAEMKQLLARARAS